MPVKITYIEDQKYGLPEQKKYPMPDKQHVISAIKFFNYVDPKYEKQLAKAILARIEEYGMSLDDIGVGEGNRFSKYISDQHLAHHGIKGQKWGIRRYQNEDGTLTAAGRRRAARTYDYKTSTRYKNASLQGKKAITGRYESNRDIFGTKKANEIEYKVDVERQKRSKVENKEHVKRAIAGVSVSTLLMASPYLIMAGSSWYERQCARIDLNNMAMNAYGGANNIPLRPGVHGFGLGFKQAKIGKEVAEKVLGRK